MPDSQPWRYLFASVQGTSHVQSGLPCQDSSLVMQVSSSEGAVLVLAASDGAGSASHSDQGSKLACQEFAAHVQHFFDSGRIVEEISREVASEWMKLIAARISLQAQIIDQGIREFACTFLGVVVSPVRTIYIQIGDGAIVKGTDSGYEAIFWPQSGEYVNTTSFLTDANARESMNYSIQEGDVGELALFSDGLQMLALNYAQKKAHEPFFKGLFPALRSQGPGEAIQLQDKIVDYLSSPSINSRTDDDKTLVLATKKDASQPKPSEYESETK